MEAPKVKKRKSSGNTAEVNDAPSRAKAAPARFEVPTGFKRSKLQPAIPLDLLKDPENELWLVQLPPKFDLKSIEGVRWKVRLEAPDGVLGRLENAKGMELEALAGPEALGPQFSVVMPSPDRKKPSLVRRCTRHVTLAKAVREDQDKAVAEGAVQGAKQEGKTATKGSKEKRRAHGTPKKKKKSK